MVVEGLLEVEVIYDATLTLFNMLILFILVGGVASRVNVCILHAMLLLTSRYFILGNGFLKQYWLGFRGQSKPAKSCCI